MFLIGKLIYRKDSVGMGDFKLVCVIGFFAGPLWSLVTMALAIMIGGIWGIVLLAIGKKAMGKEIPFGPFIAIGCFFTLFFKVEILIR